MRFDFGKQSSLLKILDDQLARFEPVHAAKARRRLLTDPGIAGENIDHRQFMAPADFVIVEIVGPA